MHRFWVWHLQQLLLLLIIAAATGGMADEARHHLIIIVAGDRTDCILSWEVAFCIAFMSKREKREDEVSLEQNNELNDLTNS